MAAMLAVPAWHCTAAAPDAGRVLLPTQGDQIGAIDGILVYTAPILCNLYIKFQIESILNTNFISMISQSNTF